MRRDAHTRMIHIKKLFYDSVFSKDLSIKEKNKYLILKFQDFIKLGCINLINDIMSDT